MKGMGNVMYEFKQDRCEQLVECGDLDRFQKKHTFTIKSVNLSIQYRTHKNLKLSPLNSKNAAEVRVGSGHDDTVTQSDPGGRGLSVLPLHHWSKAGVGAGGGKGALSGVRSRAPKMAASMTLLASARR